MIRSCLLRLITFLVVLMPTLVVVSWLFHVLSSVALTFPSVSLFPVQVRTTHIALAPTRPVSSGFSIVGGPSLSSDFVDRVLVAADSPAQGTGQDLYGLSQQYQIDDAYALAVFAEESSFGKSGVAVETHGLGNIICAGYPTCDGRFRSYSSWLVGYEDFYRLLSTEYIPRGLVTVEQIEPVYAPSNENDTALYVGNVERFMRAFRRGSVS